MVTGNCADCAAFGRIINMRSRRCYNRLHREANPDKYKAYSQKCRKATIKNAKIWRKSNPEKVYAVNSLRRAFKANSQKSKLGQLFKREMAQLFKNRPSGTTLDHIIPLKNPLVCGLHVPWNIQYLTASENSKKNNSFDGTKTNMSWRENVV